MNIKELTDAEAIMLVHEKDEYAKDVLFKKYSYIIDIVIKKYDPAIKALHLDRKDIYADALYGFSDALISYNPDKEASLPTFISLCVDRRLNKVVRSAMGPKKQFNNNSYSLDYAYDEDGYSLKDIISDNSENDPLNRLTNKENGEELYDVIKSRLSSFEQQVFDFMIQGFSYNGIAKILNKEPKQIDNTIQRIKGKVKQIVKNT
jgi:RNA polymerase sporulation-specific sigma factor